MGKARGSGRGGVAGARVDRAGFLARMQRATYDGSGRGPVIERLVTVGPAENEPGALAWIAREREGTYLVGLAAPGNIPSVTRFGNVTRYESLADARRGYAEVAASGSQSVLDGGWLSNYFRYKGHSIPLVLRGGKRYEPGV